MEIIQEVALAIIGFAGGVSVAAGTFALITALGIVPRLAARMLPCLSFLYPYFNQFG